jgi:signal peptidase I
VEQFQTEPVDQTTSSDGKKPGSARNLLIDIIETVLLAAILYISIEAISARIRVDGFSMVPTLQSGELVVVNKLAYKWNEPETGDIVVFQYPRDPEQEYIKRVIGTAGDTVRIEDGQVYVNDTPIFEPYISTPTSYENEWIIPQDSIFVLGDNRNNSSDSHSWGPVPMNLVIGKAFVVYWPPDRWGLIRHGVGSQTYP